VLPSIAHAIETNGLKRRDSSDVALF